jgi:hypothetical protein
MIFQVIRSQGAETHEAHFESSSNRWAGGEWVNCFLVCECVRRPAETTPRSYAISLLHFLSWWASRNHTDAISEDTLNSTALLDYIRFQAGHDLQPATATQSPRRRRGARCATSFPRRLAPGFQHFSIGGVRRWAYGRSRPALSRLPMMEPKRIVSPCPSMTQVASGLVSVLRVTKSVISEIR